MAFTLPNAETLDVFSHDATTDFTPEQKEQAIQQAADLLSLATGVEDDPETARDLRIVGWGILDMAWKLLVVTDNKSETYTPFSRETIGSYQYAKMSQYVRAGMETGIEWFDHAVRILVADEEAAIFVTTEDVFSGDGFDTSEFGPDSAESEWSTDYFGW